MCLIIASKQGKLAPRDWLIASASHNPDGTGLMVLDSGELKVYRTMEVGEKIINHYNTLAQGRPHVLHQRFATHGSRNLAMCHPFQVLSKAKDGLDLYLMHNGVMQLDGVCPSGKSDTWQFVTQYLRPHLRTNPELLYNKGFKRLLSKAIGSSNKLVFLDSRGRMTIINRSSGTVRDDLWLSNTYSLTGAARYSNPQNSSSEWWKEYHGAYYGGEGGHHYPHSHIRQVADPPRLLTPPAEQPKLTLVPVEPEPPPVVTEPAPVVKEDHSVPQGATFHDLGSSFVPDDLDDHDNMVLFQRHLSLMSEDALAALAGDYCDVVARFLYRRFSAHLGV